MKRFILPLILLIAFLLRLTFLGKFPVGFTPDEASFGYDAFSILHTGRDQWGSFLPLTLKSFGDFKSPLYSYLDVPFVAIFGLNKMAVRLPNAILGSLAVLATYLLVREIGRLLKIEKVESVSLASAFLLAVSSWHIMMSRGAFEANLITFFLPLGVYLFSRALGSRSALYFLLSAIVLGLNLFTYHSAKMVTPLIAGFLVVLFWKEIRKVPPRIAVIPVITFIIFIAAMVWTQVSGGLTRASDLSIYNGALEAAAKKRIAYVNSGGNPVLGKIFYNKYDYTAGRFINNYFQYFSFNFLFQRGPAEATYGMLPGNGVLYLIELPFAVGFLVYLFRNRKDKTAWFLVAWLVVAPVPAALSTGVGYAANRVATMLPVWPIILAIGAFEILKNIKLNAPKLARVLLIGYLILYLFFAGKFVNKYIRSSAIPKAMLYGNLEVSSWLKDNIGDGKALVSKGLSEPQIYIAFANSWDPSDYQNQTKLWDYKAQNVNWVDQMEKYTLGNYTFKTVKFASDKYDYNYMVGKPEDFPKEAVPFYTIDYPDGEHAIVVIKEEMYVFAKN